MHSTDVYPNLVYNRAAIQCDDVMWRVVYPDGREPSRRVTLIKAAELVMDYDREVFGEKPLIKDDRR